MHITCARWLAQGIAFALARISAAHGSTPREQGAMMAISLQETVGTIGGGRLEWDVIARARALLAASPGSPTLEFCEVQEFVLGPALGQCCGGRMTIRIKRANQADVDLLERAARAAVCAQPTVLIYGAGHVGRALAKALAPLPLRIALIDSRADELALAATEGVTMHHTQAPVAMAEQAAGGAAHVIMTHSHALDCLIAGAVLERDEFRYLGIIGSRTKRNSFRRAFRDMGFPADRIARVVCPIGGSTVQDKRPEIIAALTAAEIITALFGKKENGG
ncbi:MAG: xanthine dehydrogenase accessory protein XdhC [Beijerinckiaceae bacterium]